MAGASFDRHDARAVLGIGEGANAAEIEARAREALSELDVQIGEAPSPEFAEKLRVKSAAVALARDVLLERLPALNAGPAPAEMPSASPAAAAVPVGGPETPAPRQPPSIPDGSMKRMISGVCVSVCVGLLGYVGTDLIRAVRQPPPAKVARAVSRLPDASGTPPAPARPATAPSLDAAVRLLQSNATDEAIVQLEALTAAAPRDPWVLANLCGAYARKARYADAADACRRSTAAEPTNWLAQYNLGCVWALQGRTTDALAALAGSVRAIDADPSGRFSKADLIEQMKRDDMLQSLRGDGEFVRLVG